MVTKIQKWGNSQGLRLTKHLLENVRMAVGDEVEVIADKEQIVIKKWSKPNFELTEMLARMPRNHKVQEECFGKPVGKEAW